MTLKIAKTKAEEMLVQQFTKLAASLPGSKAIADARASAMDSFTVLGLPHRRVEEWKYTDLRANLSQAYAPASKDDATASNKDIEAALGPLAELDATRMVFVNGFYQPDLSSKEAVDGLSLTSLEQSIGDLPRLNISDSDAVIALNTAFMSDGAVVSIKDNVQLDKPLLLVFARAGSAAKATTTRNIITIGAGAKATLIEADIALGDAGDGQGNDLSEIIVGDSATIAHIKCSNVGATSSLLSTWIAELGADVTYNAFQLTSDTGLARNNLFVTFNGEHTNLDISGAFLARGCEHIDTTLVVDHAVPHCISRELFKGVLDGTARGIFQGKVIVRQNAQKTDGKQMAQALMLSDSCEFDSKPELEIYADDVVCGHGSTSAQLDEEMMFYFRARGIPKDVARAMMIESFIGEAIDQVEHETVREALREVAKSWLAVD